MAPPSPQETFLLYAGQHLSHFFQDLWKLSGDKAANSAARLRRWRTGLSDVCTWDIDLIKEELAQLKILCPFVDDVILGIYTQWGLQPLDSWEFVHAFYCQVVKNHTIVSREYHDRFDPASRARVLQDCLTMSLLPRVQREHPGRMAAAAKTERHQNAAASDLSVSVLPEDSVSCCGSVPCPPRPPPVQGGGKEKRRDRRERNSQNESRRDGSVRGGDYYSSREAPPEVTSYASSSSSSAFAESAAPFAAAPSAAPSAAPLTAPSAAPSTAAPSAAPFTAAPPAVPSTAASSLSPLHPAAKDVSSTSSRLSSIAAPPPRPFQPDAACQQSLDDMISIASFASSQRFPSIADRSPPSMAASVVTGITSFED